MAKCEKCGNGYYTRECENCENNSSSKSITKKMNTDVRVAVYVLCAELILFVIAGIIDYTIGHDKERFGVLLVAIGFTSLFPYKISNGSNFTRFFYVLLIVLFAIYSFVTGEMWQADSSEHYTDKIGIILNMMDIFIVFKLLTPESNQWFSEVSN